MTELEKMIAKRELRELLDSNVVTQGMTIRVRGRSFTLGRQDPDPARPYSSSDPDDRVRLAELGRARFSLSVRRHTGRWEKTPFSGTLRQLVDVIADTMQHVVAPW